MKTIKTYAAIPSSVISLLITITVRHPGHQVPQVLTKEVISGGGPIHPM
jgi:hypothetical protein